jgi:hypothetical protein
LGVEGPKGVVLILSGIAKRIDYVELFIVIPSE